MKYAILFFAILTLASCSKSEPEESKDCNIEVDYGQEFLIKLGEKVCFPDGKSIEIKVIEDEYCPCDAICVWQGELSILSEIEDETGSKDLYTFGTESFDLGSSVFPSAEIRSFSYIYNDDTNNLPDCAGNFNTDNLELLLMVSEI